MRVLDALKCTCTVLAMLAACASPPKAAAEPQAASNTVAVETPSASKAWTVEQLESLSPAEFAWTHHDETHSFRAVPLAALVGNELALRATVNPSRDTWTRAVLVTARDGYKAVFSAGELRESWGPTHAFLAWRQDGAPLPENDGPFRLVVPTDGGGARCVRQVATIRVVDVAASGH